MGQQRVGHDWATKHACICKVELATWSMSPRPTGPASFRNLLEMKIPGPSQGLLSPLGKISRGMWKWKSLSHVRMFATPWTISSVQSLSRVQLFVTPWIAACQASLSITNSRSLLKLLSIKSVMPSSHLILCCLLLLLPPIPPSIKVFSNESTLYMRWPKYWSFSFSISPSNEHPGLISFRWTGWISLQSKELSRVFSNTTVQKHKLFGTQPYSQSNSHIHTWLLEKS